MEIKGKTLGIIGLGNIGLLVAKKALGLGMKVIYNDINRKKNIENRYKITYFSKEKVIKNSDILSLHVPLTNETYHLIGKTELKKMKKNAILINTSRGEIIDEKTLIQALKKGEISGAGLDVYEGKIPSSENQLLKMKNVVLTPYVASLTKEALKKVSTTLAKDVIKAIKGRTPQNIVNTDVFKKLSSKN
jgi:lactate dehydrogenase-like 2-hydroxyacid dehydrogenase